MTRTGRVCRWSLVVSALVAGCAGIGNRSEAPLEASGVVEAREVTVSAEISGRLEEIMVEEGDAVQVGDELFHLEDDLLQAELEQARAAHSTELARLRHAKEAAELELVDAQHALEELIENAGLDRASAQMELADAKDELDDAQYLRRVRQKGNRATESTIDAAEARLSLAQDRYERAKDRYDDLSGRPSDDPSRQVALIELENARQARDSAERTLNWYKGSPTEIEQAQLDADVAVAEARVQAAERQLERMEEGPDRRALEKARERVQVAEAQLGQAEAQLAAEEKALTIRMLQLELEKTVVYSPVDGSVLTRSVEVGEMIQPGFPALTLGRLDRLTITVFLPEDRYGEVSLGDRAQVQADSFPDRTFVATVIRIADQAEYTPRNVQTEEERQTTVYAVELAVEDPEGDLKPGMPADVTFSLQ